MTLSVVSSSGRYPIHIGFNVLSASSLFAPFVHAKQVCIISQPKVAALYLEKIKVSCMSSGAIDVKSIIIPDGESSKTLQMAETIWTSLLEANFLRDAVLIALGGGVVGDLVGFCAACYLRGIALIHCPTTLLGQIDSAIGGKTAVNHVLGKNLIGAFHAPQAVIMDLSTLDSLPELELRASLGELIKYAMILDERLFTWLEENIERVLKKEPEALLYGVTSACKLKINIVSQDEKEKGIRAILNFGHTIGHAIESLLNYKIWRHGEAVAVGMIVATHLSWQRGFISEDSLDRLIALLKKAKLPTKLPEGITIALILAKIKRDKKHSQEGMQWVLLKRLGEACPNNVINLEEIMQALDFVAPDDQPFTQ